MTRLFHLMLTLIVLFAIATAGWLASGAAADDEPVPTADASDTDDILEHNIDVEFIEADPQLEKLVPVIRSQDEVAVPEDDPFHEPEIREVSPSPDLKQQIEQLRRQADELMKTGRKALAQQIRANAEQLAAALAAEQGDLPQIEVEVEEEELARPARDEVDQLIDKLIDHEPEMVELLVEVEKIKDKIGQYELSLKNPESNPALKSARRERLEMLKRINRLRRELRPAIEERIRDSRAAAGGFNAALREVEKQNQYWREQGNLEPEIRELQHKIEHLRRAAENLQEAGLHDQANELRRQAEEIHADLNVQLKIRNDRLRRQRQELELHRAKRRLANEQQEWIEKRRHGNVAETLIDLRQEVRQLRNEIREMHQLLEQHIQKRGGKEVHEEEEEVIERQSVPDREEVEEVVDEEAGDLSPGSVPDETELEPYDPPDVRPRQ